MTDPHAAYTARKAAERENRATTIAQAEAFGAHIFTLSELSLLRQAWQIDNDPSQSLETAAPAIWPDKDRGDQQQGNTVLYHFEGQDYSMVFHGVRVYHHRLPYGVGHPGLKSESRSQPIAAPWLK